MTTHRLATVLSVLLGLACLWFAYGGLFTPEAFASGFGIPSLPQGDAVGFLTVKAGRDLANGAIVLTLLALGRRRSLAWVTLLFAMSPCVDAFAVLTHGGTYAAALGIHASTCAGMLLTAGLLFASSSESGTVRSNSVEREGNRILDRSSL
ncbi:DUF4267 domain-containing protein [Streptomyces sp. NPDC057027]|uniref:DUF4267 domain-containing protein n=1 Tax=Streptomyces sp. NPDC057027 TaxID=3346004 RepID=UPI0036421F8C